NLGYFGGRSMREIKLGGISFDDWNWCIASTRLVGLPGRELVREICRLILIVDMLLGKIYS
ncbi:hypothetical protein KA005_42170, partial [bacterium]|nr:hypothetical protein [bacterium]